MSNYSFKNNEFKGDNIFGDVYSSAGDFIQENETLTEEQVELVKIIFNRVNDESEKNRLLGVVKTVSQNEPDRIGEKEKGLLKTFYEELVKEGAKKSAQLMCSALSSAPKIVEFLVRNTPQ